MSEINIQSRIADEMTASAEAPFRWGPGTPRGAKAVFTRIIKEGATVPLFIGQTLVNALRDLRRFYGAQHRSGTLRHSIGTLRLSIKLSGVQSKRSGV